MAFHIPGEAELAKLHDDADRIIDAVTAVADAIEQYGPYLGLSTYLPAVEDIEKIFRTAKALLDKLPA